MEREEEKPKPFTVKDRRRFSSEGDLKPEFRENEETPSAAAPEPPPVRAAGEAQPVESTTAAAAHTDQHAHDAHHAGETGHVHHPGDQPHDHHAHPGGTAEITFGTFLVGLSTQALMLLGDIPDPQTGKPEQDLAGAQQLIDIVGMLEQKTRGNLDRDEAQLIEAILYELRMKYVERARLAR
jgi:hypothetical protein